MFPLRDLNESWTCNSPIHTSLHHLLASCPTTTPCLICHIMDAKLPSQPSNCLINSAVHPATLTTLPVYLWANRIGQGMVDLYLFTIPCIIYLVWRKAHTMLLDQAPQRPPVYQIRLFRSCKIKPTLFVNSKISFSFSCYSQLPPQIT